MTISTPPQQPADPAMDQALQDLHQSLAQALQLAVAHQQSGQLEEAETLYRSILQTQPNHPEANHSLGVLAVQAKQAGAGLPYFAAALEAKPEQQQYWLSYIDALIQADETETAKQVLELGRQHGLQGDDMEALAGRLNEGAPSAAPSDALAQSVKPARQAARHSGGKKAPGATEINEITKFLQGETYRKDESKSIADKPTKTMLRSRVQEAVGINNAIIIINEGDIPAAVQIAKELPSYIVYIFDPVLEDRVAASGLQNIQLVPWDNCPSYHELDAEAHGLAFGLEAELDLAVRTIVPDVSIAAWQHLNLYYIFLILKWYDALWSELGEQLRDSKVHVFIFDTPAEYYFNSFIPSYLLLCYLNKHNIKYSSYTYGKKSENTYLVPCLSGVDGNEHLDQIMIHLPTCMYDINYFNQEIGATDKALVNIESKYWNLPVSSHKNISLVNAEDMFLKLLKPLQYKINTFTHQLEKTLFKCFKPFIGVQTYRARQIKHISQLYRAQLVIYYQLNQYFEVSKPSKILLSDHDTGFHGPIISFAEKHSLPVILLPHSKMTCDISFKYRNIMALTHPMQVQEIFDASGKSVLHSRLIYPETFSSSSMATDGMRTISLLLNTLSFRGIYFNRCADYLNGIRLIIAWCKENNINLKIRFKPGYSLLSLFARDIGVDVNMLSHQNETMEEHLKDCDLCLMYGVPTTGALHFLKNSIPILNPTEGPLTPTDMSMVNPDIILPESVDATLLRLNSFKSDPMKFLSFRITQFRNYVCQFQSAQPLRTYL